MTEKNAQEIAEDIETIDDAIAAGKTLLGRLREAAPPSRLIEQAEEVFSIVERIEQLIRAKHALRRLEWPADGRLQ